MIRQTLRSGKTRGLVALICCLLFACTNMQGTPTSTPPSITGVLGLATETPTRASTTLASETAGDWTYYKTAGPIMIMFDQNGLLWVSGWGFVEQWNIGAENRVISRFDGYNFTAPPVIVDEQGDIWLGTNPVQMYSQGVWQVFPNVHPPIIQASFGSNEPESIWAKVWDRSNRVCLAKYDENEWEQYCLDSDLGVDFADIWTIGYRPYELWVGLYNSGGEGPTIRLGIWKFDGQSWERIPELDDATTGYFILGTPQDSFWLVDSRSVLLDLPGHVKRYDGQSLVVNVESNERIRQLVLGPENALWAVPSFSDTLDVIRFDDAGWQRTSLRTELTGLIPEWMQIEILSLAFDRDGQMCISTDKGVFCKR